MKGWKRRLLALWLVILCLGASSPVWAGGDYMLEDALSDILKGDKYQRHLTGAKYRLAVFSFDDPQETGLGDDAALLVARHILFSNSHLPIGVLNFKQNLAPAQPGALSYFDKVDLVMKGEQVTLAVWGRVLPLGDLLVVDTFLQVPRETLADRFKLSLPLPQAMGGGAMQAHLRPDRIHVQRLELDKGQQATLAEAARYMREVRAAPDIKAKVIGPIPRDKTFQIAGEKNGWVQLRIGGGPGGWAPDLSEAKHPLFEPAAFCATMFQMAARDYGRFREKANLTLEAQAAADQLEFFNRFPYDTHNILSPWLNLKKKTGNDTDSGSEAGEENLPGGAAFANLRVLSLIAEDLENYGRARIGQGFSRQEVKKAMEDALFRSLPKNQAEKLTLLINQRLAQAKERLTQRELNEFMRKVTGELYKSLGSEKAWKVDMALKKAAIGTLYADCRPEPGFIRTVANQLARASLSDPGNVDVLHNLALLFNYLGDTDRKALAEGLAAQYGGGQ